MRPTAVFRVERKRLHSVILDSKPSEIRKLANWSAKDYTCFKTATGHIAQARWGDQPENPTAHDLSQTEEKALERRVNKMLRNMGVKSMPGREVLYWRWHRVLKNMSRTKKARHAVAAYVQDHESLGGTEELEPSLARFHYFVREEIYEYVEKNPNMTWAMIPNSVKTLIRKRINAQLHEEGIPPVGEAYMLTRMEMAMMKYRTRANRQAKMEEETGDKASVTVQARNAFLKQDAARKRLGRVAEGHTIAQLDGEKDMKNANKEHLSI